MDATQLRPEDIERQRIATERAETYLVRVRADWTAELESLAPADGCYVVPGDRAPVELHALHAGAACSLRL